MSGSPVLKAERHATNSLFEEDYWLDVTAPGSWEKAEVKRDGRVIGRMPYVVKRRYGLTAVSTPRYTPWLGPWIETSGGKGANEIGHQHEVLGQLVQGLPKAQRVLISCAPEYTNLMALHWAGYSLQFAYTYRLTDLSDHDQLWRNMRDKTRNASRKAEKVTVVNTERTLEEVMPVLDKTYKRQGVDLSASYATLERIEAAMAPRGQRTIYSAEDAKGRIHAFAYVVFDERHCFYLAGGGDPELRDSGGQTLAMWHAIKNAGSHSRIFDFEGSMLPGIEQFVRGFGPVLTPRYAARWNSAGLQLADAAQRAITSRGKPPEPRR